jgi:hypothetical protein
VLNRAGKLTLRQILEEERRAIQNEINEMRKAVEEELRKIKEESSKCAANSTATSRDAIVSTKS